MSGWRRNGSRTRGAAFWLFALPLVVSGVASARQGPATQSASEVQQARQVLDSRNRETMHPGNPLKIHGLEQGAHDPRANTPALANSDRQALDVELEETARRTRAIYENGASFHEPLPRAPKPGAARVAPKGSLASSTSSRAAPALVCGGLAALAVIALAAGWIRRR